jgi:hypothetical protein
MSTEWLCKATIYKERGGRALASFPRCNVRASWRTVDVTAAADEWRQREQVMIGWHAVAACTGSRVISPAELTDGERVHHVELKRQDTGDVWWGAAKVRRVGAGYEMGWGGPLRSAEG